MNICFLAAADSIHSVRWIKYFQSRGHKVHWISLVPPTNEALELISKVNFYEIAPSPMRYIYGRLSFLNLPKTLLAVRKLIIKIRPQILHIHSAGVYGLVGAFSGAKKIIITPWGSDVLLNNELNKFIMRRVVARCAAFTCDGENTREALIKLGARENKINLIRFGTDTDLFKPARTRAQSSDPAATCKIISLRALEPVYDIGTLLRAAARVIAQSLNVKFEIAGDGSLRKELIKMAESLGIQNKVSFIGKIASGKLPDHLNNADIYVSTSLSDSGLAASTAEAMACGLPVAVSDSGDNGKWVVENKGGYIFPLRDDKVLALRILELIRNSERRKTFGLFNRALIEKNNNHRLEMNKVEDLYAHVV